MVILAHWRKEKKYERIIISLFAENICSLHLMLKLECPHQMLCAKFAWNLPSISREYFWSFQIDVFLLCHHYHPLEKCMAFIWTNLNCLYPRILCTKFGWNWPNCSWEDNNVTTRDQKSNLSLRAIGSSELKSSGKCEHFERYNDIETKDNV